jgi:hypothetical protein
LLDDRERVRPIERGWIRSVGGAWRIQDGRGDQGVRPRGAAPTDRSGSKLRRGSGRPTRVKLRHRRNFVAKTIERDTGRAGI